MREKTGRPIVIPHTDPEIGRAGIRIGKVSFPMLSSAAKSKLNLAIGVYGTAKYGRSRYSTRPGIYGYDKYGGCTYH